MKLELLTRTTHNGDITKQELLVDNDRYEIKGFDIWEGEHVNIGDKLYELHIKDYLHGGEVHGNVYQYLLMEVEKVEIKDISKVVMNLLGEDIYEENFKIKNN